MKHIVCYSGGKSSAEVALSVSSKFGAENTILLNHDISPNVEAKTIKDFKVKVANHIGVNITYANHKDWDKKDQFDICVDNKAFKVGNGNNALCTSRLKTEPFMAWLKENYEDGDVIYYGFDANEQHRITRRSQILGMDGYKTDYPLACWPQEEIVRLEDVGIEPPCTYGVWKHGNCVGCLKALKLHWYCVYVYRPDIFEKAKWAEEQIGHSIMKEVWLCEIEEDFASFKAAGVVATEHTEPVRFWIEAKKRVEHMNAGQLSWDFYEADADQKPCDCSF